MKFERCPSKFHTKILNGYITTYAFYEVFKVWRIMISESYDISSLIGERQTPPKVLYLRSLMHPPPTHLHVVCNDHLIANFLSFHMSLVVVIDCGVGNALRGFEIGMFYFFLKLYFIHISKDILPLRALNTIKQCKWYFSRKLWCQGLRKYKIGKSAIMQGRTAAPCIMHDF